MKKLLTAAALTAMMGTAAQADFLRVEMGGGIWSSDPDGTLVYKQDTGTDTPLNLGDGLGYDKESLPYLWLNIKHPVPILPNVRLEYVDVDFEGTSTQSVTWDGITYGANTYTHLQLTQYDAILYYNLLDNTAWMTLDLGLDVKFVDTSYDIQDPTGTVTAYSESESLVIPLLYARTRVEIPATNFGLEADLKYIGNGDSQFYDFRAKVDYTLDFVPVVQPAIEVGYRVQKFKIDEKDADDVIADIDFSGMYVGLMLRF